MTEVVPPIGVLEVQVVGPDFESVHALAEGGPELVLGRDGDCGVFLPDPRRNISRRHLALVNRGGELHFHVLSVVNGVAMPFGDVPPGTRGVLPPGDEMQLADYRIRSRIVSPSPLAQQDDPWVDLERGSSGVTAPEPAAGAGAEDDPFGEWGFETTFGPGAASGPLRADALEPARDLQSFFRGLGLDGDRGRAMTCGEMEDIGALVRSALLGLLELQAASAQAHQGLGTGDHTRLAPRMADPLLQAQSSVENKLRYLFASRVAPPGSLAPQRAVQELLVDLLSHQRASLAGARGAVSGTVREFEPGHLKQKLLGEGSRLFESARAWDAYTRHYADLAGDAQGWTRRLLDKYFTPAYLEERKRPPPTGRHQPDR